MRTSCPHCNKVYDIDDSKVPVDVIEMRCSGCSNNFEYRKTTAPPADTSDSDDEEFWQPPTINAPAQTTQDDSSSESVEHESSFQENSTIQALEPSIQAEFGSMDDIGDLSGPEIDGGGLHLDASAEVDSEGSAESNTALDLNAPPLQESQALPGEEEKQDFELAAGGSDYWDQMQSIEDDTAQSSGLALDDIEEESDSDSKTSIDDEALLADLKAEQQKVAAESQRLETVTMMLGGEYAQQQSEPQAPPPSPPQPKQPEPAVVTPPEKTAALPPENILPIEPEPSISDDAGLDDLMAADEEVSSAENSLPPVTRLESKPKPKSKKRPAKQVAAPQAPQQPVEFDQQPLMPPAPESEIDRVRKAKQKKKSGATLSAGMTVGAAFVMMALAGGGWWFLSGSKSDNSESVFESEALKATKSLADEKVQLVAVTTDTKKPAKPKTKPKVEPVVKSGDPYEIGLEAFRRHDMAGYKEAESYLLKAYKKEEKSLRSVLALSELYSTLGGVLGRKELLKKSFDLAKNHLEDAEHGAQAKRATALAYFYSRQYQQAFDYIQQSLALAPEDSESYLIRGMIMWKLGKGGGGLQQAVKKAPESFQARNELTRYYLATKKYSSAVKSGSVLVNKFPARYEGYAHLMRGYAAAKNYKKALKQIEQAVQFEPNSTDFYLDAADIYLQSRKHAKAADLLELYLVRQDKMPRDDLAKIYLSLGKAHLKNNPKKASFYFDKIVKWEPKNVSALNYLGLALFEQKNYKDSIKYFKQSRSLDGSKQEINFNLGLAYYHGNYFTPSQKVFSEILATNPRHEEAQYYLASVYEKKGDRIKAIEGFRKVLAINRNNQKARKKLKVLKAGR